MTGTKKDKPEGTDAAMWAGVGVGIGSAALVAALLYANRGKVAKAVSRNNSVDHED